MAVARRGLACGRQSHAFTEGQFLRALDAAAHAPQIPRTVYAELDGAGRLVLAGAGCGAGSAGTTGTTGVDSSAGAAWLAARARPAPHPAACNVELVLHATQAGNTERVWDCGAAGAGGRWLALRVRSALAPHDELRVWPAAPLAGPPLPPPPPLRLTPGNQYECDTCNAQFDDHRSLKEHSAASCGSPSPRAFWRRVLRADPPRVQPPGPLAGSMEAPPGPLAAGMEAPPGSMEALEALATAWGRARGAHVCVYCGKLYSRRYGLKIHIRTHTGYKPLRCRHCARAFGDPSNLNKHVRLHAGPGTTGTTGARGRHACGRCPAVLARRRDLLRHLRARHPPAAAAAGALT